MLLTLMPRKGYYNYNITTYNYFARLVRIIECPPRREESLEVYTENMTRAVRQLPSPLTCVIIVIKQNTISGGGFQLNKVCVSQSVSISHTKRHNLLPGEEHPPGRAASCLLYHG